MSEVASAGKRGRAWSCKNCPYKGERHMVFAHIFKMHLTMDEWPYQCPVCDFSHYHHPTFLKHTKWYKMHKMMVAQHDVPMPAADCRPDLMSMVERMAEQLTVEESVQVWSDRKRRPMAAPLPVMSPCTLTTAQSPPLACVAPPLLSNLPATGPETAAVEVPSTTDLLSEFLPGSDSLILMEDTSEFLVEKVDKATNTSPMKESEEVQRLHRITQRQERALVENTSVVRELQALLREHGIQHEDKMKKRHHGNGNGEKPNITSRRPTPPPKIRSVVYQLPSSIRPRTSSRPEYHRPSPLDNLFKPDPVSRPTGRSRSSRR